jgi:hypothetical protein
MKRLSGFLALQLIVLISVFNVGAISNSTAEECPKVDLATYGLKVLRTWKTTQPVKIITWSSNSKVVAQDPVSEPFSATEEEWLNEALESWGSVIDSIAFVKVDQSQSPILKIGFTQLTGGTYPTATTGGTFGLWGALPDSNMAAIRLLDSAHRYPGFALFATRESFIHALQNEIGNVLGVSDYDLKALGSGKYTTIFDNSKGRIYGQVEINDLDASIMRQAYGESSCPSAYSASARAANLKADRELGAKYLAALTAANSPTPVPVATVTPTPTPSATPTKAVVKATTITCIKGKITKKVTAVNPKCPSGYKKKA